MPSVYTGLLAEMTRPPVPTTFTSNPRPGEAEVAEHADGYSRRAVTVTTSTTPGGWLQVAVIRPPEDGAPEGQEPLLIVKPPVLPVVGTTPPPCRSASTSACSLFDVTAPEAMSGLRTCPSWRP